VKQGGEGDVRPCSSQPSDSGPPSGSPRSQHDCSSDWTRDPDPEPSLSADHVEARDLEGFSADEGLHSDRIIDDKLCNDIIDESIVEVQDDAPPYVCPAAQVAFGVGFKSIPPSAADLSGQIACDDVDIDVGADDDDYRRCPPAQAVQGVGLESRPLSALFKT